MREKILFDGGWLFHEGDIETPAPVYKGPIYMQAKTERKLCGPAARHYNAAIDDYAKDKEICTEYWQRVDLPHDYVIRGEMSPTGNYGLGFFTHRNAWYRKTFLVPEEDEGRRLTLYFEGVATHATVYVNGCLMKHSFCGYTSFEVDFTDIARYGEKNVVAVYVETGKEPEGWWYEGGGIYRHVWLMKTDSVHIDRYGIHVIPQKRTEREWTVSVDVTAVRRGMGEGPVTACSEIVAPDGTVIASVTAEGILPEWDTVHLRGETTVGDPLLWDIDTPHLYTVRTALSENGAVRDGDTTRFGFRTVEIDAQRGLFLNGRYVRIKGVCAHQDFGLTGKAVPDNIQRHKVAMLKEMGANGLRCSHYPHSEAMMDALDEAGILVMDETRWYESTEESCEQLAMLVKRDRNRPSVIMWSLGNEEPYHITPQGGRIAASMAAAVRKLDPTRPITTAVSNSPEKATVYDTVELIGVNYNLQAYDALHEAYPHLPIFSSECSATSTTRGWYEEDAPERAYCSAYDKDTNNWFLGREKTWKFMSERPWLFGSFQWIAFEHRGEAIWPRICSQAGAIDLFLQKKDAFYQNQSHWSEKKMIHLLPHWNFRGREGEPIRVVAYTNCEAARLYVNDACIGECAVERGGHAEWRVPYAPGRIWVEGLEGGTVICTDERVTSGPAAALKLTAENTVRSNGRDILLVTCTALDAEGREVPNAEAMLHFHTNALGRVVGTGSDIADHTPVYLPDRRMRAGRASCAVQVGTKAGTLKVYVTSPGLYDGVLSVEI